VRRPRRSHSAHATGPARRSLRPYRLQQVLIKGALGLVSVKLILIYRLLIDDGLPCKLLLVFVVFNQRLVLLGGLQDSLSMPVLINVSRLVVTHGFATQVLRTRLLLDLRWRQDRWRPALRRLSHIVAEAGVGECEGLLIHVLARWVFLYVEGIVNPLSARTAPRRIPICTKLGICRQIIAVSNEAGCMRALAHFARLKSICLCSACFAAVYCRLVFLS
jgi:hypothetical protein